MSAIVPLPGIISDCCRLSDVECIKYLLVNISKQFGRKPNHRKTAKQPWPFCLLLCVGLHQVMLTVDIRSQDSWGGTSCWEVERKCPLLGGEKKKHKYSL